MRTILSKVILLTGIGFAGSGCLCQAEEMKPAMELSPADPAAVRAALKHETLGDEYYRRQRISEAIQEWQWALELNPSKKELAAKIQNARLATTFGNDSAKAPVPKLDVSQRCQEDLRRAEKYYQASSLKEAELVWNQVLALEPQNPQALAGISRLREEPYQENAHQAFDRMTAELYIEGMKAFRQGNWTLAEAKLAEANKINPEQPQVKKCLTQSREKLAQQAREQEIREYAEKAYQAEKSQEWLAARENWQKLQTISVNSLEVQAGMTRTAQALEPWVKKELNLGQLAVSENQLETALASFMKILTVFPDHREAKPELQKVQKALLALKAQNKHQGETARGFNAGVASYRQGDLAAAIRAWEAVLAENSNDAECQAWLTRAKREQYESQTKQQQRAEARYADGLAAYQRGELDEALTCWKETLELNPHHEKARANIQKVQQEMK